MTTRELHIPQVSLVVLIGASGSGKSTFAKKHFAPTEILSSDFFRGLVANDENDQSASADAFGALHDILRRRLTRGLLTVVDATNVEERGRRALVSIARDCDTLCVAIVLDLGVGTSHARNRERPDRQFGKHVVAHQHAELRRALRGLEKEGFQRTFVLNTVEEVDAVRIVRDRLWNDLRDETGGFDLIGDVHGCRIELEALLEKLGYGHDGVAHAHPEGRRAIFLGDLVDRGPDVPGVLRIARAMVEAKTAFAIVGNHEAKLVRALRASEKAARGGAPLGLKIGPGLQVSLDQLAAIDEREREQLIAFMDGLVGHYVLDGGRLVVAHAGLKEAFHGRASRRVREFGLYGETTGEVDSYGLPVRANWAESYRGKAAVVYGHTPVPEARWVNGTICVDTGCVFGGKLTALRWPERELVSVAAAREYFAPARPLASEVPARDDGALLLGDVAGKRFIETRLVGGITIREENATAALEAMSRFSIDPRWMPYLPATMSPPETAPDGDLLERPEEAFAYYLRAGVDTLVCETKHMGSRAVVVCAKDARAAERRFGDGTRTGVIYTRTGRPFFADEETERVLLDAVRAGMDRADLWKTLSTDWVALDAELLPWSAKAMALLRSHYAAVGASGRAALSDVRAVFDRAAARDPQAQPVLESVIARAAHLTAFTAAYRPFVWEVASPADLRLAPFHLLASEGAVHDDRDHLWHLETLGQLSQGSPLFMKTEHQRVSLGDPASEAAAIAWWRARVDAGGEGMVVKPLHFPARPADASAALVQPALKVRGPEYLRLIYGPEYREPARLSRLKKRQVGGKRRLAAKEHALGFEALHRFVDGEPLHRVHECVFGVLALESEPIDPRL